MKISKIPNDFKGAFNEVHSKYIAIYLSLFLFYEMVFFDEIVAPKKVPYMGL